MTPLNWQKLSLAGQMGNVGSEVSRALSLQQKGDKENAQNSAMRALDLVDATLNDARWSGRSSEIFKLREVLADILLGDNFYGTKCSALKDYFLQFALLNLKTKP